ncbi:MAG: ABC transporter ATP-binding protein [Lysinibacillus sp.]
MNLIEIEGLCKEFVTKNRTVFRKEEKFLAVNDINLTIKKGEILGLIGESGSGKSTIGRMILQLIAPSGGKVLYEGEDLTKLTHKQRKPYYKKMQMIFQDSASSFNPRRTIGEQIVEPMLRLEVVSSRQEAVADVTYLLKRVGLKAEHFNRYPHQFSGGQRQRIGIARALALKPEFLVLDEPTSALDVSIQAQILNLLLDLKEEFNLTYLFIGHNLSVIKFICDRVAVLYKGRLLELAGSDELYENTHHPVTRMLLNSVLTLEKKDFTFDFEVERPAQRTQSGCVFSARCPNAIERCFQEHPDTFKVNDEHVYACYNPVVSKEAVSV